MSNLVERAKKFVVRNHWIQVGEQRERERIIKLLEDSELQRHLYFWLEFSENDKEGLAHKEAAIALIKGENK